MKDILLGIDLRVESFFIQHFTVTILLPSALNSFWEKGSSITCLCSFISNVSSPPLTVFSIYPFVFNSLNILFLGGLFFLVLVGWGFIQQGALWPSWICRSQLHNCYTAPYYSTILDAFFHAFFHSFFSSVSVWVIFIDLPSVLVILSTAVSVYWFSCQRHPTPLLV